jgi:predicted enzyme related to lactoylglutathione lyase
MSDQTTSTTSAIAWFEIPAQDSERAKGFYGKLFGWQFQPFGEADYHVSYEGGGAIYGAPGQNGLMTYFAVEQIEDAIARVAELGGKAGERQEIPGIGFYAQCADSEGNPFGLYQGAGA